MTTPGPASPVRVGDVVAGKYHVERILGVGGMGMVVAARHVGLGELRAIKLMLGDLAWNPEAVRRFLGEARAAARLKSEHVARVYDVGNLESGAPFMVMEYLEGTDLHARLKQHGPMPVAEAIQCVLEACEAVGEAHVAGIIHRDLKPANLFLTRAADGTPSTKVLDFGISKLLRQANAGHEVDKTKTTAVLGTPHYMSPEQMKSTRDVDTRTDIWALGAILYELTTGVVPFDGETITQLCLRVVHDEPVPPSQRRPGLPIALDRVVLRCLAKQPDQRPRTIADLAIELLPLGGEGARASVDRITRIFGAPTHPPSGTVEARADVQAPGAVAGGTGASWGQTSKRPRYGTPPLAILLASVLGVVVVGVGAGVVLTRRAPAAPTHAPEPAPDPSSTTPPAVPDPTPPPSTTATLTVAPAASSAARHEPPQPSASAATPKKSPASHGVPSPPLPKAPPKGGID